MHELIEKLLQKRGIDLKDLDQDERETFDKWQFTLTNKKEVTPDDILKFCDIQIELIEKQFDNVANAEKLNERLVFMHSIYRKLRKIANNSDQKVREKLESDLTSMIFAE